MESITARSWLSSAQRAEPSLFRTEGLQKIGNGWFCAASHVWPGSVVVAAELRQQPVQVPVVDWLHVVQELIGQPRSS